MMGDAECNTTNVAITYCLLAIVISDQVCLLVLVTLFITPN
jgi:hypothetical protein